VDIFRIEHGEQFFRIDIANALDPVINHWAAST
jgi:hypothetical protein